MPNRFQLYLILLAAIIGLLAWPAFAQTVQPQLVRTANGQTVAYTLTNGQTSQPLDMATYNAVRIGYGSGAWNVDNVSQYVRFKYLCIGGGYYITTQTSPVKTSGYFTVAADNGNKLISDTCPSSVTLNVTPMALSAHAQVSGVAEHNSSVPTLYPVVIGGYVAGVEGAKVKGAKSNDTTGNLIVQAVTDAASPLATTITSSETLPVSITSPTIFNVSAATVLPVRSTATDTNIAPTAVSVTNTVTNITPGLTLPSGVCSRTVVNTDTTVVYCGQTNTTGTATGIPLNPASTTGQAGGSYTFHDYGGPVYCITASGSTTVRMQPTVCP